MLNPKCFKCKLDFKKADAGVTVQVGEDKRHYHENCYEREKCEICKVNDGVYRVISYHVVATLDRLKKNLKEEIDKVSYFCMECERARHSVKKEKFQGKYFLKNNIFNG